MVGRSSYVAPRWSSRLSRPQRRPISSAPPKPPIARAAGGLQATSLNRSLNVLTTKRVVTRDVPLSTKVSKEAFHPCPAFQRAGVKSAAAGTIKWRDSGPLDQADLNRLISDVSKVPGADARTPVVAVSRHGVTAAGAAATLGPEDLLAAWAAKRPG